jgi:hypothetical protein
MSVARATLIVPGTVHEAETCWYDTSGWPRWVDGLDHILSVDGEWPKRGATVTWESHPAGRGRVIEHVILFEQLSGQTVEVRDDSLSGRQTVSFTPADEDVEIALSLDYQLTQRSLLTPVVDLLFIRRALTSSLRSTLARFGTQLGGRRADRAAPGPEPGQGHSP